MEPTEGELISRHIVYIGMRDSEGKLVQAFYECNTLGIPVEARVNVESDEELYLYYPKALPFLKNSPIGAVYHQTRKEEEKGWRSNPVPLGRCQDTTLVTAWVIRDRTHRAQADQRKRKESDKTQTVVNVMAALDPWRAEYAKAFPQRRVVILADIIAYITRG